VVPRIVEEADWTFTAESADEVDAAELALHRVRVALVLVDTARAGLVQLVASRTRATIAAGHVLTASHRLTRTCQLGALVYIFTPTTHDALSLRPRTFTFSRS